MTGSPARALRLDAVSALLLTNAAVVAWFWWRQAWAPHMIEQAEVRVYGLLLWWKAGVFPYSLPTELPLLANPYGPLYSGLLRQLPVIESLPYLPGRLLSVVSVLGALGLVGWWVLRSTRDPRLALWCALLPLTAKPFLMYSCIHRVDGLAIVLSVAGFCMATLTRSRSGLFWVWLFFLLAFATKTSQLAAPAATVAFLWGRDRRRAWALGAAIGLTFPAFVLVLERLAGGAYLASAALGNVSGSWLRSAEMATRPMIILFWLVALAWAGRPHWRQVIRSASFLYVVASWVTISLFGFNPLTGWNFLLELFVALALLTGEVLGRSPKGRGLAAIAPAPRRFLITHGAVSILLMLTLVDREIETLDRYRERYESARIELGARLEAGDRVAVLGSLAGRDALNTLGSPNPVLLGRDLERSPEVLEILDRALVEGGLDAVLVGDDLEAAPAGGLERSLARERPRSP